jgi:hypothetical protein
MPGIDLDVDLGPIEVMAGVRAELSTLNKHNAAWAEHRRREIARTKVPIMVRLPVSGVIPTPTVRTGINLGGPDPGYYWMVRRLVIGGVTWKTTAAGTAEVYVTGLSGGQGGAVTGPMISGLALTELVDQAASLPNKAFYSDQQLMLQAQENLMVVVDSGTAGQLYIAAAQVQVFRTIAAGIEYTT